MLHLKHQKGGFEECCYGITCFFRRVTSVGQKIPSDAPEQCDQFLRKMQSIRDYDYIWNMDETPSYFDMPESSMIDTKGVQTVKVKTTGHKKLRFTAVFSAEIKITANEVKAVRLPPMIIFKNLVKPPSGDFPPRVMVQGTKGGTMTGELMAETYANDLWRKRPGAYFQQPKSLLIMDFARAYTSKEATDALGGVVVVVMKQVRKRHQTSSKQSRGVQD